MSGITPWAASVEDIFNDDTVIALYLKQCTLYTVKIQCVYNTLWIVIEPPKGCRILLRAAYNPTDEFEVLKVDKRNDGVNILLKASIGSFNVKVNIAEDHDAPIRYTTMLTPSEPLLVPFWPRDMVITD